MRKKYFDSFNNNFGTKNPDIKDIRWRNRFLISRKEETTETKQPTVTITLMLVCYFQWRETENFSLEVGCWMLDTGQN